LAVIPLLCQTERFQQNRKRGRPKKVPGGTALVKPVDEDETEEEEEVEKELPVQAKKKRKYIKKIK
jgi:hypothetical protein